MTKFATIDIKPKSLAVTAVVFNVTKGWDWVLELAKWCGGTAVRDELNPEKAQYWSLRLGSARKTAFPGSVVVKYDDGSFQVIGRQAFNDEFTYRNGLGTFPCYLSPKDSKYHKKASSYSELSGYARCSPKGNLTPIVTGSQHHSNRVDVSRLCVECFGCRVC